jgi:ABC-type transport system involved in cytochrome c biogenesis ATPase subunit
MIHSARFTSFKSLADLTLTLSPMTLLVGANGSGKTSILQALHDLLSVPMATPNEKRDHGRPGAVFAGKHDPGRLGRIRPDDLPGRLHGALSVEVRGPGFGAYGLSAKRSPVKDRFSLWRGLDEQRVELVYGEPDPRAEQVFFAPLLDRGLGSVVYLHFNAQRAAEPAYSDDEQAHVEADGAGLAVALQRLQVLRDGRFEQIEAALTRLVPSVRRLRAVPHRVTRIERVHVTVDGESEVLDQPRVRTGARVEAEIVGTGWIAADLLSEGTVLALALLTVLIDQAPRLVLLDDLDQALHPSAQRRMFDELRTIIAGRKDVQVVATTHSPYLLDHAQIDEVRVLHLDDEGRTRCRPLSEHPKWAKRAGFMSPGEFWAGVGEAWVGE